MKKCGNDWIVKFKKFTHNPFVWPKLDDLDANE